MKHATSSTEKGFSRHRRIWHCSLIAGLLLALLAVVFSWGTLTPLPVFASARVSTVTANFSTSPSEGPVGTVVAVHISGLNFPDGTQVRLGETPVFSSGCTVVANSLVGTVQQQTFSGWLRWPSTTGTGWFQVCARVGASKVLPGFTGFFRVLSATPPQVTVAPTALTANKQATVTGANFLPAGTSVNLLWQAAGGGQTLALGTVTSDNTGAFTQTFTVPAKASTGSYVVMATVGSGQPPTLSASTTFHVNGITIAVVPTPSIQGISTPTASATASVTTIVQATPVGTRPTPTKGKGKELGSGSDSSSMILPLVLGGALLIVVALIISVLFVLRQRALALTSGASKPTWFDASAIELDATFPLSTVPHAGRLSDKAMSTLASGGSSMEDVSAIPFDPALAEAMRQAQVSLFATPRPPVDEKIPS